MDLGFTVDAEVRNCDVVAVIDDLVVITELKTSLNLKLLVQATERQKLAHQVYLAVPAPARKNRAWRGVERVVKRLGLGLLLVAESPLGQSVRERFPPNYEGRINKRARSLLLTEFNGRSHRSNTGGTNRKIVTAYRETTISIAAMLSLKGPQAVKPVRLAFGDRSARILADNHYGWFERVRRGVYALTKKGTAELQEYPELYQRGLSLVARIADETDPKQAPD